MNPARVLLEETLALLRAAEDTPLGGRIDAAGMAGDIERSARTRLGEAANEGDWPAVRARMDALLGVPPSDDTDFVAWLARTAARLRDLHPRATTVAAMRLKGLDDRDIAERLGLGPRLVGRIR